MCRNAIKAVASQCRAPAKSSSISRRIALLLTQAPLVAQDRLHLFVIIPNPCSFSRTLALLHHALAALYTAVDSKVVPQNQTGAHFHSSTTPKPTTNSNNCGDDPAAEWLYLLFCRFVQEDLLYDVYANVGIRAGGRPPTLRQNDTEETAQDEVVIGAQAQRPSGEMGGAAGARQERGHSSQDVAPVADARIVPGVEGRGEGEVDFFFPVTPEQLIMLNLGEIAAGERGILFGGKTISS